MNKRAVDINDTKLIDNIYKLLSQFKIPWIFLYMSNFTDQILVMLREKVPLLIVSKIFRRQKTIILEIMVPWFIDNWCHPSHTVADCRS